MGNENVKKKNKEKGERKKRSPEARPICIRFVIFWIGQAVETWWFMTGRIILYRLIFFSVLVTYNRVNKKKRGKEKGERKIMRRLSDVHLTITRSLTLPSTFMGVGKVNCALRIHFVFFCFFVFPFVLEFAWRVAPFWKKRDGSDLLRVFYPAPSRPFEKGLRFCPKAARQNLLADQHAI